MADIAANLGLVRDRVARAAERSGRSSENVELVVVSKTWPAEVVGEVIEAGHLLLGENKLQEAADKIPRLSGEARWHFIGHLQRNKARKALPLFEAIHSVDSLRLATQLDRQAGELGLRPVIYLQVNEAGEATKSGFAPGELHEQLPELVALPHVEVRGLMCIPPAVDQAEEARPSFASLRALRDELQERHGLALPGLSMGMSHDFEIAIEEGSTIVRVGSSIFGPRLVRPA